MSKYVESSLGLIVPEPEYMVRIAERAYLQESNTEILQERITALELALEDVSWMRLTSDAELEFSREGLGQIARIARIFYLKNPIVQRGINVKKYYVWGQGVNIRAAQAEINDVIQVFLDDRLNRAEITGHQAHMLKETDLETDGNLFLVFFTNPDSGRVRVRSIPFEQIAEKISNPEDAREVWYYKRVWNKRTVDISSGIANIENQTAYYPNWLYRPDSRPASINGEPVLWDSTVYHIMVGGFSHWQFGVSEIYAAIDWAKAYKEFLEDWATLTRAYSRFAWQLTTKGGKSGIAAAKARLGTTLTTGSQETNPPPTTGSIFIANEGTNINPIRTAGATVSAEDGRRMLLMVAAAVGLPETFFGDVSVGTLATATSLDRPTELAMKDRQTLWAEVFRDVLDYVLIQSVKMPGGPLAAFGQVVIDENSERIRWNEDIDPKIDIDFPPVVAIDVTQRVAAITSAANNLPDEKLIAKLLLITLGEDDVDEILDEMFPEDGEPGEGTPAAQAQEALTEAAKALRGALMNFKEKYASAG